MIFRGASVKNKFGIHCSSLLFLNPDIHHGMETIKPLCHHPYPPNPHFSGYQDAPAVVKPQVYYILLPFLKTAINLISNQSAIGAPASPVIMEDMTGLALALLIPPFQEPRAPPSMPTARGH